DVELRFALRSADQYRRSCGLVAAHRHRVGRRRGWWQVREDGGPAGIRNVLRPDYRERHAVGRALQRDHAEFLLHSESGVLRDDPEPVVARIEPAAPTTAVDLLRH